MCEHRMVYYGVIDILLRGVVKGAIDVWKCKDCGKIFADERRIGVIDSGEGIGFEDYDSGEWFVLVCRLGDLIEWRLVRLVEGMVLEHSCIVPGGRGLKVGEGYTLSPVSITSGVEHRLFRLTDHINRCLELSS